MNLEVGETLVYPHHGAAKIVKIEKREFAGVKEQHLQLKVTQGDLLIWVPFSKVETVGTVSYTHLTLPTICSV